MGDTEQLQKELVMICAKAMGHRTLTQSVIHKVTGEDGQFPKVEK